MRCSMFLLGVMCLECQLFGDHFQMLCSIKSLSKIKINIFSASLWAPEHYEDGVYLSPVFINNHYIAFAYTVGMGRHSLTLLHSELRLWPRPTQSTHYLFDGQQLLSIQSNPSI